MCCASSCPADGGTSCTANCNALTKRFRFDPKRVVPSDYVGPVLSLCQERRGIQKQMQYASSDRVIITIGKFSVVDIFDNNKYAHDPRNDFLNWSIIDAGAFDYAADAWGTSYGAVAEWYQDRWALRVGLFDLSTTPNSTRYDPKFDQFQMIEEIERDYSLFGTLNLFQNPTQDYLVGQGSGPGAAKYRPNLCAAHGRAVRQRDFRGIRFFRKLHSN